MRLWRARVHARIRIGRGGLSAVCGRLARVWSLAEICRNARSVTDSWQRCRSVTALIEGMMDLMVRSVVVEALRAANHRVTVVETADEALNHEAVAEVDLVLSDIVLPGRHSGLDAVMELRRRRPGLKVLLMSGYAEEAAQRQGRDTGEYPLLHKPFTLTELYRKIDSLLK